MARESIGRCASDWEPVFRQSDVLVDELNDSKSRKSKSTKIGKFLAKHVDTETPIQVKDRTGKAILRLALGRANERRYYFEIRWDEGPDKQSGESDESLENADRTTADCEASHQQTNQQTYETTISDSQLPATGAAEEIEKTTGDRKARGNDEDWD